jgi:serine protease
MATVAAVAFAAPALTRGPAAHSLSAAAATRAAMTSSSIAVPGMQVHVVNLHQQFARAMASKSMVTAPEAGIVPMMSGRGTATTAAGPAAAAAAASCKEPDCNMSRHGGKVQHAPHVYLLLWGPDWATAGTDANSVANYLAALFAGLGPAKYDSWSTVTSQYGDGTGHPVFGKPLLNLSTDIFNDATSPPATVGMAAIAAEAKAVASTAKITDTADAQVVVAFESGQCFNDGFAGNCGSLQSSGYCGWHSAVKTGTGAAYLPYVNLPWQLDALQGCGANFVNGGSAGLFDGWSLVGGHEYAETVTDPNPPTGYIDNGDLKGNTASGGEIADKCVWAGLPWGLHDPFGDVTLPVGTKTYPFAMQSLWSNAAKRCVMTSSPKLFVRAPAPQKAVLGRAVSLQLTTVTNTGVQKYTATGLPHGLTITAHTGRISGKPTVTAGTFRSKVTISDYAKSVTIAITWFVSSPPGAIRGFDAKCVDSAGGKSSIGNKIDIWSCTGKAPQTLTFAANRELQLLGKCVTGGASAFLGLCKGTSNQAWTRQANGEYILAANGRCLTDPGSSRANGTKLTLAACKNTANQHWSLP